MSLSVILVDEQDSWADEWKRSLEDIRIEASMSSASMNVGQSFHPTEIITDVKRPSATLHSYRAQFLATSQSMVSTHSRPVHISRVDTLVLIAVLSLPRYLKHVATIDLGAFCGLQELGY